MDEFDKAVEFLTRHPEQIVDAWRHPSNHPGGALFRLIPDNLDPEVEDQCLTTMKLQVKSVTNPILLEVMANPQIPQDNTDITVDMLPAFAEYQRRIHGQV